MSRPQTLSPGRARRWTSALLAAAFVALAAAPADAASLKQLNALKAEMDRSTSAPPAGVAGWGVNGSGTGVVVSVVGMDRAGMAFARSWQKRSDGVRIEHVAEAPQTYWNVIGGQAIYGGGSRCSAGFNAYRGSARYVVTAGHCTNIAASWTGVGGALGTRSGTSFPTNDYGAIQVTSGAAASTPLVDRYSAGSDVRVSGASNAAVGQAVCRSGSTTGWRCGSVQATNQTVCYSQGCVYQTVRTTVCAEPGDSGGSLVSNPGTGTSVRALGLTSGGSGNCRTGGTTFFQPVTEPLSVYGLTLAT